MISPCIKQCKLSEGICSGCSRTLEEIVNWSKYSEAERIHLMEIVRQRQDGHCKKVESKLFQT